MKNTARIFLDYDDLLVGLTEPWLAHLRDAHNLDIPRKAILYFSFVQQTHGKWTADFFRNPGIYDTISPLPGARVFVDTLRLKFGEQNVFVISASYDAVQARKEQHAWEHFSVPGGQFIHAREKHVHTARGILVDDNPGNVARHVKANGTPGVVYTGQGEYGWANPENYGADPWLAGEIPDDPRLFRVCDTYAEMLAALSPAT